MKHIKNCRKCKQETMHHLYSDEKGFCLVCGTDIQTDKEKYKIDDLITEENKVKE